MHLDSRYQPFNRCVLRRDVRLHFVCSFIHQLFKLNRIGAVHAVALINDVHFSIFSRSDLLLA